MKLLDKIKIIQLERELEDIKSDKRIASIMELRKEINELQLENRKKGEHIKYLGSLLGCALGVLGKPVEVSRKGIYNDIYYFEISDNQQNFDITIRGGIRRNEGDK